MRTRRALNEGRGVNPGDTRRGLKGTLAQAPPAQRRPGREPRRHSGHQKLLRFPAGSLNEGRGVNPGDTPPRHSTRPAPSTAQRRPGREPRRHDPAAAVYEFEVHAQRRPGREPRRHSPEATARRPGRRALNEGRGVNPGDTRLGCSNDAGTHRPLNEGRGVNPGDTANQAGGRLNLPISQENRAIKERNGSNCPKHRLLYTAIQPLGDPNPRTNPTVYSWFGESPEVRTAVRLPTVGQALSAVCGLGKSRHPRSARKNGTR